MKKMLIRVAAVVTFLLTMIAGAAAASASIWITYEPTVPAKLRK
ncbi:MAG: AgrD family cyclic lactone autoinducer peptide [Bacillota bacterium]